MKYQEEQKISKIKYITKNNTVMISKLQQHIVQKNYYVKRRNGEKF